ncbi:MAG TPA: leucine--tRNA ligase [Candidatus Paceibacterota bacterium]|nr:leucine--tRNA ligase [Candidatus Paceibacterota bacterium]
MKYDHNKVEKQTQRQWEKDKTYQAPKKPRDGKKFFGLIEFPYPSGEGLHVGHIRSNTAMDIISRKRRMEGFDVLYPIGWDAFGLPTEQYAIKTGIHPKIVTKKNTDNFRKQLKALGFSFDWSREINTTDPEYYKFTQWIFLQLFKHGLAFQKETLVWWCDALGTVLANEEVIDGKSERGGFPCVRIPLSQWMLAITKYAARLDADLEGTNFLENIKTQQRNWIGKSEGGGFSFPIEGSSESIDIFTSRPDTLYGVTYLVVAPEHPLVSRLITNEVPKVTLTNIPAVEKYIREAHLKSDLERAEAKTKSGVVLEGVYVLHPATGERVSVWVADYVLADYGTGAIMAVPAHDERDLEFAKLYNLPVKTVVVDDALVDSKEFSGTTTQEAKKKITEKFGKAVTTFKLRDWVFSRQRYWGEPFPIVWISAEDYTKISVDSKVGAILPKEAVTARKGGKEVRAVPIPEKFLPVELPNVKDFAPKGDGKSALGTAEDWLHVFYNLETGETIPVKSLKGKTITKNKAKNVPASSKWALGVRETDTMPNWAGSSWYWLRFADSKNSKAIGAPEVLSAWNPVDWYNGGMEHVTLHLLYSRFWHKFLFDIGVVPTSEPFAKRTAHGMILAEGGVKMSKSLGNVVSPDSLVKLYGADTLRVYEMFAGPFDQPFAWSTENMIGSRRFIERVWKCGILIKNASASKAQPSEVLERIVNLAIQKIGADIENMQFNTAISTLMIAINAFDDELKNGTSVPKVLYVEYLKLVAPFAPHIAEVLWKHLGGKGTIHLAPWPQFDPTKIVEKTKIVVVQVNGKVRGEMAISPDATQELVEKEAADIVKQWLLGKEIRKVIYVPGRIVNFVL